MGNVVCVPFFTHNEFDMKENKIYNKIRHFSCSSSSNSRVVVLKSKQY